MLLVPEANVLASRGPVSRWELRRMEPLGNHKWCRIGEDIHIQPAACNTPPQQPLVDLSTDPSWSVDESNYLLELCNRFDNRLLIVADRYKYTNSNGEVITRTAHEIQSRHNHLFMTPYDNEQAQKRRLAEESFDARSREQIEEEQELLRLLTDTQRELPFIWRRRQAMIARLAGDTFVMNNPSLVDLVGQEQAQMEEFEEAPSKSKLRKEVSKSEKSRKVKRAVPADSHTVSTPKPRQSITPVLRTACLKPIKAGLARQVDKRLVDMGLPLRPNYPSERNCELYDQIRALLAGLLEAK